MDESKRRVPPVDIDDDIAVRSALGGEVLERPAIEHQRLFNGGLMERCVHRLAESRMALTAARAVHTHRRPVDDDADGLGAAHEQPRSGI